MLKFFVAPWAMAILPNNEPVSGLKKHSLYVVVQFMTTFSSFSKHVSGNLILNLSMTSRHFCFLALGILCNVHCCCVDRLGYHSY